MSFLNTILDSEKDAKRTLEEARIEAATRVRNAEENVEKELLSLESSLKTEQAKKLEAQKGSLQTVYENIVHEGTVEADVFREKASHNEQKAVTLIREAFAN